MKIKAFGATDIGKKRSLNEDNYTCVNISKTTGPLYLLAVADGIGGHSGGEIASSMAIATLEKNLLLHFQKNQSPSLHFQDIIENAFKEANRKIFQKASKEEDLTGMGTTLTAALITPNEATICNIGDSRAYLIRENSLHQITLDHSWEAETRRNIILSKEEFKDSPFKHMLTRFLGFEQDVRIDTFHLQLFPGDHLILCTDGLYSLVPDKDILKIFKRLKRTEKICRELINLANKKGGEDNITAAVAYLPRTSRPGKP
jgi:serine/threonine protein phosphatase PrpC